MHGDPEVGRFRKPTRGIIEVYGRDDFGCSGQLPQAQRDEAFAYGVLTIRRESRQN